MAKALCGIVFLLRTLTLILAISALVVPTASGTAPAEAFCVVVIQPLNEFQQVRIVVDEDLSDEARQAAWDAADGDGDGTVTAQEGHEFRARFLEFWPAGAELANHSLALEAREFYADRNTVDPIYAATWRQMGHGFPGIASGHVPLNFPLTDAARLETQEVREYTFQVQGDPTQYWLHGGTPMPANTSVPIIDYQPRAVIEYVVVTAPRGWEIVSLTGYGYNGSFTRNAIRESSVELEGFDTGAPWSILYENAAAIKRHQTDDGIPSPSLAALGLALLGAARALRR